MSTTDPAAAVRAAKGWAECAADCGWPLDPAGGHDRHPGCETRQPTASTPPPAQRTHRPLRVIQGGKQTRRVA